MSAACDHPVRAMRPVLRSPPRESDWTLPRALCYASRSEFAMDGPRTDTPDEKRTPASAMTAADDRAFSALFRGEFGYVTHSLRRLGVASRDLDDVAHEVFLAVYRAWKQYDPARPIRPWLFGFAFRVAANHRRAGWSRRVVLDEPAEIRDSAPDMAARLDADRDRALVLEALDSLDLDHRAVFVMVDIDGAAQGDVASTLGIPVGTVSSRLWHARKDFTAAVKRLRLKRGER